MDIVVDGQNYEIKVRHLDGGTSFYDYSHIEKGVYLMINPCELTKHANGVEMRTSTMGEGSRFLLFAYSRKNKKRLQKAAELTTPLVQKLVELYHSYKKGSEEDSKELVNVIEGIKKNLA